MMTRDVVVGACNADLLSKMVEFDLVASPHSVDAAGADVADNSNSTDSHL
jgi:hypothetical protein